MFFMQTKTDIAKGAMQMVIAMKAAKIAEQQVGQYTSLDIETIPVKVGTTVAGQLAAYKLRPLTDKAIDIVINSVQSWKLNKVTK